MSRLGCAFQAAALLVNGASASSVSAWAVSPARRSHAGAHSRASQSVSIHARFDSCAAVPFVPTSRVMYGFSICRSVSFIASFHRIRNAVITFDAHTGWSDHGSREM
jgi:hypothetical protein